MLVRDGEKLEPLCTVGGNVNDAASMGAIWQFLKKLNILLKNKHYHMILQCHLWVYTQTN